MGANERELKKSTFRDLIIDEGQRMLDGKSYWPDHINVRMTRAKALIFASRLFKSAVGEGYGARHIDWDEEVNLDLHGKLSGFHFNVREEGFVSADESTLLVEEWEVWDQVADRVVAVCKSESDANMVADALADVKRGEG